MLSFFSLVSSVVVGVEGSVDTVEDVQKILVDFDVSCNGDMEREREREGGFGVEICCLFDFDEEW